MDDIKISGPMQLAYLGDSVYETAVRYALLKRGEMSLKDYNKIAVKIVSAPAQYKAVKALESEFTEDEAELIRRGRNAKGGNVPKSASVEEYRTATGFESLMGRLYLEGKHDRISYLVAKAIESLEV